MDTKLLVPNRRLTEAEITDQVNTEIEEENRKKNRLRIKMYNAIEEAATYISKITVSYDGYDDNGYIYDIKFIGIDDEAIYITYEDSLGYSLQEDAYTFVNDTFVNDELELIKLAVIAYVYNMMPDDWSYEVGSYGIATINVETKITTFNHVERLIITKEVPFIDVFTE